MTTTQIKAITETIATYYNIPSKFKIVHAEIESDGYRDSDGYEVLECATVNVDFQDEKSGKTFCVTNSVNAAEYQELSVIGEKGEMEVPSVLEDMILKYRENYADSTVFEIYNELKDIVFFKAEEKIIKVDEIDKDDVIMLKQDYLDAKKAYFENISVSLLQDMLKEAQDAFKTFVSEKNITSVRFENDVYSEDYMPDWAHLIVFSDDAQNDYAFVQTCSETYDEVQGFDGEIYLNNEEVNEEVFEYIQQWYMKIFQAFDV